MEQKPDVSADGGAVKAEEAAAVWLTLKVKSQGEVRARVVRFAPVDCQ